MVNDEGQYQLSPAYDMVPSATIGGYPIAGFQHSPFTPSASEAKKLGKIFGLSKPEVNHIADEVINVLENWQEFANKCGVSEEDSSLINPLIKT
jgi:serine/threonine-protein kinase HipA